MADIIVAVIVVSGLIAVGVGIRGSLRRDAEFKRRYAQASAEERVKLEPLRPRNSWVWLNFHSTSQRWLAAGVVASIAAGLVALLLKWNGH